MPVRVPAATRPRSSLAAAPGPAVRLAAVVATLVVLAVPAGLAAQQGQHEGHSPYAGTGSAEVPTLTAEEVSQLRAGEGMGLARAAELNGYPGPRHVLDLADSLGLTAEQVERTQAIFETMHTEAVRLGEAVIAAEKALSDAFAAGADRATIEERVTDVGALRGALRWVHLRAHLELAGVLTRHQRHEYDRLRGYGDHDHGGP